VKRFSNFRQLQSVSANTDCDWLKQLKRFTAILLK